MANTDFTANVATAVPWGIPPTVYLRKEKMKVSEVGTTTNSDVYNMIDIPANTLVLLAWINVDVASTTGSVAYSDTSAGNTYFTAGAVTATGIKLDTTPEVYKVYSTADILKITVSSAVLTAACEITAYALCVDLNT